jgi:alpha-galactosidase
MARSQLPWSLSFTASEVAGLSIQHHFDIVSGRLSITVVNTGSEPANPGDIRLVAAVNSPAASGFAWLQGRYMQTDAFTRAFGEPMPEGYTLDSVRERDGRRDYVSREMVALELPVRGTPALLAGSLRMDRTFLDIEVGTTADDSVVEEIALVFDLDGLVIAPGQSHELPPVLLIEGSDVQPLVARYADEVGLEMHARVPGRPPTGWCSWYYFYNRVSEADVRANVEVMRTSGHPAEYVQVDDGYQAHTGDWLRPNAKFPSGMGALASAIRDAGFRPGIWLAPFVLHEDSEALRDHPEMALTLGDGSRLYVDTWLGRCAVLDCSHPGSEAWLRSVVSTVVRDWGYEYLKLDALAYAAQAASRVRYHATGTTAAANLRRGLEIIRQSAGDDTFILGCTCHFGPAIGLVDAMRVGPDVKESWADGPNPSVRHAMRMSLARNWMHGRWWANDPDCLIVREDNTSLDEAETRFLATAIALTGGMVVASDDLPKLPAARRDMALALFPPANVAATPGDPSEGPVASAWRAELGGGRSLVGLLNWTDQPKWVVRDEQLEPGEIAFDVWAGQLAGMGDTLLRPHEGRLWHVTAPGRGPRVVGDSASVTYAGLFQRPVSGRLQVRNDLDRPRTVAIDSRGQVFEVVLQAGERRWFD